MLEDSPSSGTLLDRIEIAHGPAGLLQRFFSWADEAMRARGITLCFAGLDDLMEVNKANSDTWRPLVPVFNREIGGATSKNTFVLIGRNAAGEAVATQAARFYDWRETTLLDEGLSMFFADPEAASKRGDKCEISTPLAAAISGRVVYSGAVWYRPDFRGKELGTITPRVSRAYAFTRWNSDVTIALMDDAVIAGGMAERCGYTNVEKSTVDLIVSPTGRLRCALTWMDARELLSDLRAITPGANSGSAAKKEAMNLTDHDAWKTA